MTIQRGKKLGYALPLNTDFQSKENLKKFDVTKCPLHANQECIMKRTNELKSSRKLFSMKSETDDGLSSCSNFPERPTEKELAANKPILPEIEHLKGKISDKELDSLRAVLSRNADVFSKHKADIGCCNFVEHEIEIEEGSVPHREGARRMTPHKSEACRKEIEMLMEYDMIEPSKSPWACGVVMAKKKGGQLRFCCDFRYLIAVTIKDAYPIPRIDESLSKLGDAKFFTTLDLGSAFWQVPLRKQDREKTGFACELGLFQWKRMPFGLSNATATFQRLMAQALTSVTNKYGNLIMCYVDDVVIATPTLEEALSGVKASRARLMNEAESRRKETTPSTFTTKKLKTLPEEVVASNLEAESANSLKVDYGLAAKTALQNVKQDLATKEVEQWVRSELENTDLRENLNTLGKTTKVEDKEEPRKQGLKLNVISGRTFGMTKEGTKIMSIISVAGHQVVKNLSEPSEITLVHLDIYADYLREKDPKLDSRAVRALLTTGGPRLMKVDGHYINVHGPYPILMNVDGINIYTKAHITDANDQIGRIYIGQEELKVRRIGHNAMLEQDAVHIGCEADLAAHVLDVQGRQLSVKGLLDTGAVVSVMPVKTWTDMGFERSDLIPTNIRLAAANQGAIYVTGRTPIISLQLGGRHLWMSFLVVENLDESDQFILGRDFVRNFDVTIDLNDGLIRIKDPERKYEKRPLNRILINQAKVPIFLDRKVRLKPNQAVVATFRMRNLNELSNNRQVCLVPNPNSKSSAILGRSFSLTHSERTVCECIIEHRGNNSDNTEGKEAWLCFASEHRLSECGKLEKV